MSSSCNKLPFTLPRSAMTSSPGPSITTDSSSQASSRRRQFSTTLTWRMSTIISITRDPRNSGWKTEGKGFYFTGTHVLMSSIQISLNNNFLDLSHKTHKSCSKRIHALRLPLSATAWDWTTTKRRSSLPYFLHTKCSPTCTRMTDAGTSLMYANQSFFI